MYICVYEGYMYTLHVRYTCICTYRYLLFVYLTGRKSNVVKEVDIIKKKREERRVKIAEKKQKRDEVSVSL